MGAAFEQWKRHQQILDSQAPVAPQAFTANDAALMSRDIEERKHDERKLETVRRALKPLARGLAEADGPKLVVQRRRNGRSLGRRFRDIYDQSEPHHPSSPPPTHSWVSKRPNLPKYFELAHTLSPPAFRLDMRISPHETFGVWIFSDLSWSVSPFICTVMPPDHIRKSPVAGYRTLVEDSALEYGRRQLPSSPTVVLGVYAAVVRQFGGRSTEFQDEPAIELKSHVWASWGAQEMKKLGGR